MVSIILKEVGKTNSKRTLRFIHPGGSFYYKKIVITCNKQANQFIVRIGINDKGKAKYI
jgi:hypothetical protein